jgi:hypothetical protein
MGRQCRLGARAPQVPGSRLKSFDVLRLLRTDPKLQTRTPSLHAVRRSRNFQYPKYTEEFIRMWI